VLTYQKCSSGDHVSCAFVTVEALCYVHRHEHVSVLSTCEEVNRQTAWSTVLDTPTVAKLVEIFPTFRSNRRFVVVLTTACSVPVLCQLNPAPRPSAVLLPTKPPRHTHTPSHNTHSHNTHSHNTHSHNTHTPHTHTHTTHTQHTPHTHAHTQTHTLSHTHTHTHKRRPAALRAALMLAEWQCRR
jgi:hypothetical protein